MVTYTRKKTNKKFPHAEGKRPQTQRIKVKMFDAATIKFLETRSLQYFTLDWSEMTSGGGGAKNGLSGNPTDLGLSVRPKSSQAQTPLASTNLRLQANRPKIPKPNTYQHFYLVEPNRGNKKRPMNIGPIVKSRPKKGP